MRACKRCRYGDDAIEVTAVGDIPFVLCRLIPPTQIAIVKGGETVEIAQRTASMKPTGWCGQFKLSLWKLIFGHGARTQG